jgi:dihydroorotate dehydrogenase
MSLYDSIIRPALFKLPTETAHEIGINVLRYGLSSDFLQNQCAKRFECNNFGELKRFGLTFRNPLGMAAGFDKNGIVVNQLSSLGFGFVEVGTLTFDPQKGNEKPRLFRLPKDQALINRLGFNNQGTPTVIERLKKLNPKCVLGVNIGKNKDVPNEEAIENYLKSFNLASEVADYISVNVSSPNTPNLRELQKAENLNELLKTLQGNNFKQIPLLVKIAPDLSEAEIETIVDIALKVNLAGIIATNTTISRDGLQTKIDETGGLSGKPLKKRSTEVISTIYRYSKGKIPIIGVGGIFTPQDAFEKICAGAGLIQAYTGFIYNGLRFAKDINFGLIKILKESGVKNLDDAIGSEVK